MPTKDYETPYSGYIENDFYETNRNWLFKTYGTHELDWYIQQRNHEWYDTYFAKKAVQDHQAKNNCRLGTVCLEYMEEQGWIDSSCTILDPMCGIASLLIVAAIKGYDGCGVELEELYYNDMIGYDIPISEDDDMGLLIGHTAHVQGNLEAFRKATEGINGIGDIRVYNYDSRKLGTAPIAIQTHTKYNVISSPPYMALTEQTKEQAATVSEYSGHKEHHYGKNNPATLVGTRYRREMEKIYTQLYSVLQVGAHVCLLTRNCISEGKLVVLDKMTISSMERAGFTYIETKRASLPDISFLKRNNWIKHFKDKKLPLIDWEECTFYVKEK
jgi:hypothetical protein